jgi:hypothetical protein
MDVIIAVSSQRTLRFVDSNKEYMGPSTASDVYRDKRDSDKRRPIALGHNVTRDGDERGNGQRLVTPAAQLQTQTRQDRC